MIQRLVEAEEIDYIADAIVGKSLDDRKLNIFKEGDFEILMGRLKDDLNRRTMVVNEVKTGYTDNEYVINIERVELHQSVNGTLFKLINLPESNLDVAFADLFDNVTHEVANSIIAYRNAKRNEDLRLQIERLSLEQQRRELLNAVRPSTTFE